MNAVKAAALAACALALTGCASAPALGEKALGNLEYCKRTYVAVVGGLGVPGGSLNIECPAKPFDPPAAQ